MTQCQIKSIRFNFTRKLKTQFFFRSIARSNFWQLHLSLFRRQLYWTYHSITSKVVYLTRIIKFDLTYILIVIPKRIMSNLTSLAKFTMVSNDLTGEWHPIWLMAIPKINIITFLKIYITIFKWENDWVNLNFLFLINY